jgi:hypothetical protein
VLHPGVKEAALRCRLPHHLAQLPQQGHLTNLTREEGRQAGGGGQAAGAHSLIGEEVLTWACVLLCSRD